MTNGRLILDEVAPNVHNQYGPMMPPIGRVGGVLDEELAGEAPAAPWAVLASRTSRYFRALPVLKRTTVSSGLKNPVARSLR